MVVPYTDSEIRSMLRLDRQLSAQYGENYPLVLGARPSFGRHRHWHHHQHGRNDLGRDIDAGRIFAEAEMQFRGAPHDRQTALEVRDVIHGLRAEYAHVPGMPRLLSDVCQTIVQTNGEISRPNRQGVGSATGRQQYQQQQGGEQYMDQYDDDGYGAQYQYPEQEYQQPARGPAGRQQQRQQPPPRDEYGDYPPARGPSGYTPGARQSARGYGQDPGPRAQGMGRGRGAASPGYGGAIYDQEQMGGGDDMGMGYPAAPGSGTGAGVGQARGPRRRRFF